MSTSHPRRCCSSRSSSGSYLAVLNLSVSLRRMRVHLSYSQVNSRMRRQNLSQLTYQASGRCHVRVCFGFIQSFSVWLNYFEFGLGQVQQLLPYHVLLQYVIFSFVLVINVHYKANMSSIKFHINNIDFFLSHWFRILVSLPSIPPLVLRSQNFSLPRIHDCQALAAS
jgi:hypothetical protein